MPNRFVTWCTDTRHSRGICCQLTHPPKSQSNVLFRSHAKFRQKDIRKRRIHKYQYFSSQEVQSNGNKSWRIRNESATNEFPFIRKRQRASTRSKKLPSANQAAAADRWSLQFQPSERRITSIEWRREKLSGDRCPGDSCGIRAQGTRVTHKLSTQGQRPQWRTN